MTEEKPKPENKGTIPDSSFFLTQNMDQYEADDGDESLPGELLEDFAPEILDDEIGTIDFNS